MKNFKTVVVGIKFDEHIDNFAYLHNLRFLQGAKIFLVHASKITSYGMFPELKLGLFPSGEGQVILEQAVLGKLTQLKVEMEKMGGFEEIATECLFSENPKKAFCQYVDQAQSDLVVLMDEKKHFLVGGFLHYQLSHSKVPIFILKHQELKPVFHK